MKRMLFILLGSVAVILGVVGIFLPLLPTTPFLLLAAALYFRSSPTLYNRLIYHRYLGSYIRNFREYRAIPLRAKIISVSLVWLTLLYCAICVAPWLWLSIAFIVLAGGITWHILSYRTLERIDKNEHQDQTHHQHPHNNA